MVDERKLKRSDTFPPETIAEIQRAAAEGIYSIRGSGAKRRVPNFDDLVFLGASMSRYPLEGYRETCATNVTIGARNAEKPIELDIPITIAGMSFGALGANAKQALGMAATMMGTSTTTGDGGMTDEERAASKILVYQYLPSRYGMDPDQLRRADAIEVVVGQGAKPGGGGMLLGQKITERVAGMRTLPEGIDQRSACRHPDFTGPDDLQIKIQELREITDWQIPIYIKIGASRTDYDVLDLHREVQLIVSGGIRTGADVAKALAMGADAVSLGMASLMALNCNAPIYVDDYEALGTRPGYCHHCHTGRCPVGITTQDPELEARLDPEEGARRVRNYLSTLTLECQTLARACGKSHVHNLEPEDLAALTIEAAAMAGVPLAGTDWIPGRGGG
jgi:glutamate synthase domain-containing protein 2